MDALKIVYNAFISDEIISADAAGRIKYYELPENMAITEGVYIMIQPLDVPTPADFADNVYLKYDILLQIETWSKSRSLTKKIANRIEAVLWDLGLLQTGGLDEYDAEIFRDARRYRGKFYTDFKGKTLSQVPGESVPLNDKNLRSVSAVVAELIVRSFHSFETVIISSSALTTEAAADRKLGSVVSDFSSLESNLRPGRSIRFLVSSDSKLESEFKRALSLSGESISVSLVEAEKKRTRHFYFTATNNSSMTANAETLSARPVIELTNLYNSVRIDWQPTVNTTSYTVYRSDTTGILGEPLSGAENITANTFTDATAIGGSLYRYTVRAINENRSIDSVQQIGRPGSVPVYESRLVDFEGYPNYTVYGPAEVTKDFLNYSTLQGGDRLKTDPSGRLRFEMPAGQFGSANTGGIIKAAIAGKSEYTLEYEIRFDNLFPWGKGGKIPGLSGGVGYTGGVPAWDGDGFSVRLMWREDGRIIPYVYHTNQPDYFGDDFGATIGYFDYTKTFIVKIYVKLNNGLINDGILRVYLDDVLSFEKTNIRYRTNSTKIDTAHLSIFAGGGDETWAMPAASYIRLGYIKWS